MFVKDEFVSDANRTKLSVIETFSDERHKTGLNYRDTRRRVL